jgi:hypothetical protein
MSAVAFKDVETFRNRLIDEIKKSISFRRKSGFGYLSGLSEPMLVVIGISG